jgi:hypothetical protein
VAELVRRALSKVRTPSPDAKEGASPDDPGARCAASGWPVHDSYGDEDDTTECPWCETRVRVVAHRRRSTQVRIVEHH